MEDPGQLRNLVTDQTVRVARAVVPLVVVPDDRQLRGQFGDRRDDLGAQDRVGIHLHPLIPRQALLLEQDVVGNADLADVMEEPAPFQGLQLRLAKAHHPPDVGRDLHHAFGMVAGERVTLVHGLRQAGDGLREHLPHFDESVVRHPCRVKGQGKQKSCPPSDVRDLVYPRHQPCKRSKCE